MNISEVIRPQNVFVGVQISSKPKLLEWLSRQIALKTGCEERTIAEALRSRENLGPLESTAALPFPMLP